MNLGADLHEFDVVEPSLSGRSSSRQAIQLGVDVKISSEQLRQYLARKLHPADVDLLFLAGVVGRVDRLVRRRLASGWARRFHINMRVHEPERWNRPEVQSSLKDTLNLLTGDSWSFAFTTRSSESQVLQLPLFPRAPGRVATMSYSGGLDSYCGLALWEPARGDQRLLVHTQNQQSSRHLVEETLRGQAAHHVSVPVHLPGLSHAEETYRSRMFMFLVAAAVAARLGDGTDVVISENGQGALGPALVRFPGEHPYYSTHPLFTKRLSVLLQAVWSDGHGIRFLHPAVWSTKGEILRELSRRGVAPRWAATRSCSRNNSRNKGSGAPGQCGVCGGCLLRRLSLDAAGLAPLGDNTEDYLWADLSAERLEDAATFTCTTTENDRTLAVFAILSMAGLADLATASANDNSILTLAEDLAFGLDVSVEVAESRVRRLIGVHRAEWESALARLSPSSWVRKIVEGRV